MENHFNGFIELGLKKNHPEIALENIRLWIEQRSDIENYIFGEVVDVNDGPFIDIEDL